MSRIYEALQKAETERTADGGFERSEDRVQRPSDEVVQKEVPFRQSAETSTATAVITAPPVVTPDTGDGADDGWSDWNAIVRREWSPAIGRLPALLDRGAEVEQFRSLRSRIFELRDTGPLKSILISSGMPQEGKSFVAANLAISLARHKSSKVLLIDGDMRRYTLHQLLGCDSRPGLADYLAGKASGIEVMQRAAEATGTNANKTALPVNLTFIPGGDGGDKAADLSGNPRFGELIEMAAPHFEWIIVDSSPVLPVSDGVNLARACDGVLLVARSGVTKYPIAQRAQAELKASRILGVVLNAVQQAPQTVGYYGYDAEKE